MSAPAVMHDKLYTIDKALNQDAMRPVLTSLGRKHVGGDFKAKNIGIEVIRRRSKRCVIRYIIETADRQEHSRNGSSRITPRVPAEWRIIGKVFKQNRGERVFKVMEDLWENGFSREVGDGCGVPQPLDFSSSLCMLFQEEVPGLPVKTQINQDRNSDSMRPVARALAKLHQCQIFPGAPMTITDHLMRCHPRYTFLALALPELEDKINSLVEMAEEIHASFNGIQQGPIHGDFHLGQVHVLNGHAWMVDFDAIGYADPAADLGNLLVFLKAKTKRSPWVQDLIEVFLEEYYSIMDPAIADRVPLYEGLTHLRRACKCLRLQKRSWQRKATRMIDEAFMCMLDFHSNGKSRHVN